MTFGAFIRAHRGQSGEALNQFARHINISPAYWSRIERDLERPPKDELLLNAAERLGLSVDAVFIAAGRLPPDMQVSLREVVQVWRQAGVHYG
jgi:transcriptional regulator with XRE-family HTH domain